MDFSREFSTVAHEVSGQPGVSRWVSYYGVNYCMTGIKGRWPYAFRVTDFRPAPPQKQLSVVEGGGASGPRGYRWG
jgi:hypothetical protein